jgi:hypothetical protein
MGRLFDGQRILMRAEGLEPPRAEAHQVLSLARLPVSPRPRRFKDRAHVAAADLRGGGTRRLSVSRAVNRRKVTGREAPDFSTKRKG